MRRTKTNNRRNIEEIRKKKMQDQGVTMVALVVTIIILLILSGITISFVVGDNGIIERARQAGLKYQNSALQEQIFINSIDEQLKSADAGTSGGNGSGNSGSDSNDSSGNNTSDDEDYQTTIDNLNGAIEDLKRQVEALKEKLVETEEERDTAEEKVKELENQIAELQKRISELESKQATGNATVKDVIAGKTFSNSSGTGLVGTLVSHSAYTASLSIGVNGDTAYFRIPQGAYVTNASTGYPEITAKIADINNATGYKYTQEQYDAAYNAGQSNGAQVILRAMYNSETYSEEYSGVAKIVECTLSRKVWNNSVSDSVSGYIPITFEKDGYYYLLNTITGYVKANGRAQTSHDTGKGSATISFYTYNSSSQSTIDEIGSASKSENASTYWATYGDAYNYSIPLFEKTIDSNADQIYYTGSISGYCNVGTASIDYAGGTGGGCISTITATYIKLTL